MRIALTALIAGLGLACLESFGLAQQPAPQAANSNQTLQAAYADSFWPDLNSPKLTTPEWIGEADVEAAVILAIDDMRIDSVPKYEAFLRPIIDRLKKTRGRAPISIMTCTADPTEPQLQAWLKEGLNLDVHTTDHPCPLLGSIRNEKRFDLAAASETVFGCLDLLHQIPGNRPVAYRMPCCDSMSSPSPRFYAEILPKDSPLGHRFTIDSSVMNLITPADKSLPKEIVHDPEGKERFAKYFPGTRHFPLSGDRGESAPKTDASTKAAYLQKSLLDFGTYIENYPYPYLIHENRWEFPCVVPSDWEAYNVNTNRKDPAEKVNPALLADWKAALDAAVLKKGVFTLIFHPHGWSTPDQLIDLIDYTEKKHGKRVKFLNFAEAAERLAKVDKAAHMRKSRQLPEAPLPALASQEGTRFVDLNEDGYDDIVVSNAREYGIYLYNPVEKKSVDWKLGWIHVLREGKAGDANSIPMIARADGSDNGVWFKHGAMWVQNEDTGALPGNVRRIPYEQLLKVPGPAPRSPVEGLSSLHLKPGYKADLAAHEPQVQDPVFIDWDARGRMWVVEMGDYPFSPGEKTKDGMSGQDKVSDLQTGRIKTLEDTNGDGFFEKSTLFLDGLIHPTGLAPWKDGVIVSANPDIFYAEDTDGDGRCDKRESLVSGFTAGNPQHLANGFCWGLDGWFHAANGDSGGAIKAQRTGQEFELGAHDLALNPATGEIRIESGRTQCGKWRDDFGNWFGNNNSTLGWHFYLPERYLARNPELAVKSTREIVNEDKRVYPVSPPLRRFNWVEAVNTLTSGCNAMPCRNPAFGAGEDGSEALFVCEPANNLVHREVLDRSGILVTSHRHRDDVKSEFLASADNWFRPTMARIGPDGALYVVDIYRLVLEHPEWIPAEMVKRLDIRAGEDRGRIYRIARLDQDASGMKKDSSSPGLASATSSELASGLLAGNAWKRDTAQRLLVERQARDTAPQLRDVARSAKLAASRVQALWTLSILGELQESDLEKALQDAAPEVRTNAICLAESFGKSAAVQKSLVKLTSDPHPAVRFQLALSCGELPEEQRLAILTKLASQDAESEPMRIAMTSSAASVLKDLPGNVRTLLDAREQRRMAKGASSTPPPPVVTNSNPDRQKVVERYAVVSKMAGDPGHGHELYKTVCIACHRLKNEGVEIGPDLGTIAAKPTDQLVEAILDPNRAVELRYTTVTITTRDGTEHIGMLAGETVNNVTLTLGTGTELILTKDIVKRTQGTRSLMPDGLETLLKPQDVADLLAYIRAK